MTNALNECTDEKLVQLYADGNVAAFDVLLSRYKRKVFSYIMLSVKDYDLANDVFQDTFIKAITTIRNRKYSEMGKFSAWIIRIAHNLVVDQYRRSMAENNVPGEVEDELGHTVFDTLPVYDRNVEDVMLESQVLEDVKQLVEMLPDSQRSVLLMRFYQNMSFKEIAEKQGVSINTALGRMRYA
ncbi:MAG: sigma-70 family RNA polymerase sigma factor, partial [Paludibacteraceae bacterium]|nr:sigma-70 family RNA polymerase sigma factor [Paludibacteraceae bacterium]